MSMFSQRKVPSERRFGLVIAAALALLGVRGFLGHWRSTAYITCIAASIVFTLFALIAPRVLSPLNKAWFRLGEFLGKVVSPIVLGIIFFGILTPISIVSRLFGRDALRLKRRAGNSYWIDRAPQGLTADSFKNQY